MAPEQCVPQGGTRVDPAADVWGIGASLYHALTGQRPFEHGSSAAAATDAERWPQLLAAPRALPPRIPLDVAATILGCLDPEPDLRPTPSALAEAFEAPMAALPKPRLGGWKNSLR